MKLMIVTTSYYSSLPVDEKEQVEMILNAYKRVNPKGIINVISDIRTDISLQKELKSERYVDVLFLDDSTLIESEILRVLNDPKILNRENYMVFMLDEQHVLKWNDNKTSISILDFYDVNHKLYKYFSK